MSLQKRIEVLEQRKGEEFFEWCLSRLRAWSRGEAVDPDELDSLWQAAAEGNEPHHNLIRFLIRVNFPEFIASKGLI